MDLGLEGKNALVCAASKGLGRACALELAAEGVNIALCARGKEKLKSTADEIREFDVRAVPVIADMSREENRQRFFQTALEELGSIDILINNAGGPPPGGWAAFGLDDYRAAVELNMLSSVDLTNRALPAMIKQGWGRVINIVSIAVKQPVDGLILSNASRAGLIGYAKTVATEVADKGVTVNNVCPGVMLTDRIRQLLGEDADLYTRPESGPVSGVIRGLPARRMGSPEEFGAAVAFLASERASYITGVTLCVDGGAYRGLM